MKKRCTAAVLCLFLLLSLTALSGCSAKDPGQSGAPQPAEDGPSGPSANGDAQPAEETPVSSGEHVVKITGDVPGGETEIDLELLAAEDPGNTFSGRYSAINNWPSKKFCSASGVRMEAVLSKAGVLDGFRQITALAALPFTFSSTTSGAPPGIQSTGPSTGSYSVAAVPPPRLSSGMAVRRVGSAPVRFRMRNSSRAL